MLNCCVDIEEIKQTGITLKDFRCLAFCQGLTVDLHYCDETSTIEEFRTTVERACSEEPQFPSKEQTSDQNHHPPQLQILECLVVSYSRKILKQTGDGHFSPLAAYDKESDSVLILDTARFKYGAHWTKLPLMYEAMKEYDRTTGKSRGYALLSFTPPPLPSSSEPTTTPAPVAPPRSGGTTSKLSMQPASILYRSLMNQKQKRKHYKEYIRSLRDDERGFYGNGKDIPYDVVRSYWCEERNHPSSVWEIILPMRVGTEEEQEMLRKMRLLLADLHHATVWETEDTISSSSSCKGGDGNGDDERSSSDKSSTSLGSRSWQSSVSAEETLYIIYLATLSEKKRYQLVMNFDSPEKTDVVRKQVIKEADIIASAIEVSDQLTSL